MNLDLLSLTSVCATIQGEEVHGKVMNLEFKISLLETYAYVGNKLKKNNRPNKGNDHI
jgi:hypothetical protein